MSDRNDVLRKRAEKAQAKAMEYTRKALAAKKALAKVERNADTRRKIIDGAHIQTEALNNPEIAALLTRLRNEKLTLDHDRALFGLLPLSDAEKARRGIANARGTDSAASEGMEAHSATAKETGAWETVVPIRDGSDGQQAA